MDLSYHLISTLPITLLVMVGLFGIFKKAGIPGWKAFVPVLNIYTWLELVGRPKWYLILFFIPVLNFIMGIGIVLDLLKSFGKYKFWEQFLGVIFPFAYFPYLGFNKTDAYKGKWVEISKTEVRKRSELREWADAILFAGTAALIIRTFMIEAFMIPTTSMEGSLLAGDFLFVSKFHYGVRLPMVPLSVPFIHNQLPVVGTKSYSDLFVLPYNRLPGFKDVERNDIVVFNYPANDVTPDVGQNFVVEPISMKQNYIKRCVAVAGDKFQIKDRVIYINDKPGWKPEFVQHKFEVITRSPFNPKLLAKQGFRWKMENVQIQGRTVKMPDNNNNIQELAPNHYVIDMTDEKAENMRSWADVKSVGYLNGYREDPSQVYPHDAANYKWDRHNYGPFVVPKAGETVQLSLNNIALYKRIIGAYEDHDLKIENGKILIDGVESTSYTFEMDYYWMMGDNRDGSLDSRYWGFVPENHIVGRPWFVLISIEDGVRWDRLFTPVSTWEE